MNEIHKLRVFANNVVLIVDDPWKGTGFNEKTKEFSILAGFKINIQKSKILKNMSQQNQTELHRKGFKIGKKVKYWGVPLINMNCMLCQNNYAKIWNEMKKELSRWDKLQL